MRRHVLIFAILASGLQLPGVAAAAPAPAHGAIDPATLKAADHMLAAMGYDRMMQRTCDAMVAQIGPMFQKAIEDKTGKPADAALIKQLTGIETDFLQRTIVNSPDVRRAIATLYASKFTAAELNHLADLYSDPVMHKWTEVAPDMTAKMLPLIQAVVDSHREELEGKIKAAVSSYYDGESAAPQS